jgi:hypothetical protein
VDIAERLGFSRPRKVRELIERYRSELEAFGPLTPHRGAKMGRGRPEEGFLLNEEQALLVASVSNALNAPAVRSMLIRTFVAWRRGHLEPAGFDMGAVGGMVKRILAKQLQEIVPALVCAEIASRNHAIRRGRTAGQIWKEHGLPAMRDGGWFGQLLVKMGCQIEGNGRGELGDCKARLFDPDRASTYMKNGGQIIAERYVAERRGQGSFKLVSSR